jgi:hypothetical protein
VVRVRPLDDELHFHSAARLVNLIWSTRATVLWSAGWTRSTSGKRLDAFAAYRCTHLTGEEGEAQVFLDRLL